MKSALITFAALLILMALPAIFTAITDAQVESASESFSRVALGSGNATVTLGQAAYDNSINSVSAVTSNETTDSPAAYSYNTASRALVVTGLVASNNRTLSITYDIDSTTMPTGASTFMDVIRWFWIFVIIGFAGGAVYQFFD